MRHYHFIFSALCFLLLLTSCRQNPKHHIDFYYWKTEFSINNTEKDFFEKLGCKKLYLHFFDVDKENTEIRPKAKLIPVPSPLPLNTEYTPVIFITNRVFHDISKDQVQELAQHIFSLIKEIRTKNKIPANNEIQIDCDWTETTRKAYFAMLLELKRLSKEKISCTIRLHQVKYRNATGVPPVDKGYLMCYATSNPEEQTDINSILDIPLLKNYTANINDYPLNLDVALPLYSWAVITNHLGQIKLINGITENELQLPKFKKTAPNKFLVQEDMFFHGLYLNKDFIVKIEQITPELLAEAKNYLNTKIEKEYNIVYYHLDKQFLERFSIEQLQ